MNDREFEYFTKSWKLIPATGGVFDVWVNGELVFSKKTAGRHAEAGEVRAGIQAVLDTVRPADFELVAK